MTEKNVSMDQAAEEAETVPVGKYVAIFAAVYVPLNPIAHILCNLVFGGSAGSSLDFAILLIAAVPAGRAFASKYDRAFNNIEYRRIILGSAAVDAAWQTIALLLSLPALSAKVSILWLAVILVVFVIMHALCLAFLYSSTFVRGIGRKVPSE
jgi:hypothetical protein